jgi:hypothetical protein
MSMLRRKKEKKIMVLPAIALAFTLMLSVKVYAQGKEPIIVNPSSAPATQKELQEMVAAVTEDFYQDPKLKQELENEIQVCTEVIPSNEYGAREWTFSVLTHGGKSMKFFTKTIGEPAPNGRYPLYILLHGGGQGPSESNNDAWLTTSFYYRDAISSGIIASCRGITDTWDLHFQEDSYPLYERLIEAMIVNYGADPDRVYLFGTSAGGDGVYQITPRLADRFAAANMSAGHPNNVSLLNLSGCSFCQQAGIRDYYSEDAMRCVKVAEYEKIFSDHRNKYGFGYEHKTYIHIPDGHTFYDAFDETCSVLKEPALFADRAIESDALNHFLDVVDACGMERDVINLSYYYDESNEIFDNGIKDVVTNILGLETVDANTDAFRYLSQSTRSAAPEKFVWDLTTRSPKPVKNSFYWLEAAPSVNKGIITASFDKATNTITIMPDADVNGDFAILFHPDLVDVTRPVTVKTPEVTRSVLVNPSDDFLRTSIYECGDPKLGCVGKIMYSELLTQDVIITVPEKCTVTQGKEKALKVTATPKDVPVKWKSSDKKIASVDKNGVVKGLIKGTATITATITVDGKDYSASCKVTVVSADKPSSEDSESDHTHNFIWETIDATEDTDGELRYQCEGCGEIQTRVPLTAYNVFNQNATEKIRSAKKDATVKIETSKWISFHKMVMEALAERPDVTLEISFLDEGHKGKRCTVVIPKGTDAISLVDKNGFTGFLYLGEQFGMKTD